MYAVVNFEILTKFFFLSLATIEVPRVETIHALTLKRENTRLFILASVTRRAARESARCPRQ